MACITKHVPKHVRERILTTLHACMHALSMHKGSHCTMQAVSLCTACMCACARSHARRWRM